MIEYYGYVETYQIDRPVGGIYAWGAKARVKKVGTGRNDDFEYLKEWLGRTEGEAEKKANAELGEWIKTHS